jgi:hypothetical protein
VGFGALPGGATNSGAKVLEAVGHVGGGFHLSEGQISRHVGQSHRHGASDLKLDLRAVLGSGPNYQVRGFGFSGSRFQGSVLILDGSWPGGTVM